MPETIFQKNVKLVQIQPEQTFFVQLVSVIVMMDVLETTLQENVRYVLLGVGQMQSTQLVLISYCFVIQVRSGIIVVSNVNLVDIQHGQI